MEKVKTYKFNVDDPFFDIVRSLESKSTYNPIKGYEKQYQALIKQNTGLSVKILSSWSNKTIFENCDNEFPWHDHTGQGISSAAQKQEGTHSAILWIDGEEGRGGSLEFLIDDKADSIEFKKGTFITLSNDVYHKVSHYNSVLPRVSLMISYERLDDNGS
jgi:hypothetical protein